MSLVLGLEHSCPWPRECLSLALASDFFCVLGLEPCVLDSTSGSMIHSILDLITMCYDCLNCKKISALIFLDIQKAFNLVLHQKLVKKLEYYGICGVANSLICSYLHNRKQCVLIYDKRSSEKSVNYGIPQGSILGPLLFLIYVNDLPSAMQTAPRFFADNVAFLTTENNVDNLQHLTNSELSRVSNWMLANNLVVNKAKSFTCLSPN